MQREEGRGRERGIGIEKKQGERGERATERNREEERGKARTREEER